MLGALPTDADRARGSSAGPIGDDHNVMRRAFWPIAGSPAPSLDQERGQRHCQTLRIRAEAVEKPLGGLSAPSIQWPGGPGGPDFGRLRQSRRRSEARCRSASDFFNGLSSYSMTLSE